jgi:hypothetical protein
MHLGSRSFARPIQNRGSTDRQTMEEARRGGYPHSAAPPPDKDQTVRSSRENKLVEKSREDKVIDTISH